ncbi:thioredoxin-like protein [Phaeosphaeria sp. MPI-PUGE-AT-0046c]|nr:thioredoxin-like protein [Phaeosphaeria sp. MPI-PUGE-AT-0046c]
MTTSAAQDEFNELMRDKGRDTAHPEDRHHDSDISDPESPSAAADYLEKVDTDDELDLPKDMRSNYYMPSLRSEANTGPKGVIADAQAFEQARKQAKRFTWKRNASPTPQYTATAWHEKDAASSDEDGEDSFMKEWRAARLRELQNVGQRIRSRTNSPSRRIYGNFPLVDAEGYLDALDKSSPDTTVVVFVFSDDSQITREIESCMREVAKRNDTTRFIRLHNSDAEMDEAGLPAVLAYKRGEKFAGLVPLLNELPDDSELSAVSLETCFRRSRIL